MEKAIVAFWDWSGDALYYWCFSSAYSNNSVIAFIITMHRQRLITSLKGVWKMKSGIVKLALAVVFLISLVYVSASEVQSLADIRVTKAVDNATPKEGDEIKYTVTVTNEGPDTAVSMMVNDVLPPGLTRQSCSSSAGTVEYPEEAKIVWKLVFVPIIPGGTAELTITASVDSGTAGKSITNKAELETEYMLIPGDPNDANNTGEVPITVQQDEPYLEIEIDIKPGNEDNSINLKSNGVIPVAILTTSDFDALTVDPSTVRFGKTGTEAAPMHEGGHVEDVDKDGDNDLLFHFRTQETGLQEGDTEAYLTGKLLAVQASTARVLNAETTSSGQAISGCDNIKTSKKAPELRFAGKLATTWGNIKNRY